MENPAHVYTTGIPMSEKGNFIQNKHGCDEGETLVDISIATISDHDYQNNSQLDLCNSAPRNGEYIGNSIQDGLPSEILCDFIRDAGLPSQDIRLENGLEVEPLSDSNIKFPDSPGSPFPIKICSFGSLEGFVPILDEHLENYLLPDFKSENKSESNDGPHYSEEENRTVTEAISAIAKSFGLEDLLPENFQNDNNENGTADVLCGGDNIEDISLGDFDKCSALHSSTSSLDIPEQLSTDVQGFELSTIDMLTSPPEDTCKPIKDTQISLKDDSASNEKVFVKLDFSEDKSSECTFKANTPKQVYEYCKVDNSSNSEVTSVSQLSCTSSERSTHEELEGDIPLMQIPEVETISSDVTENCSSAGTVLITTDKASKKMQIVLTLDQGQQVYDIDTESVDVNEHTLGLQLQSALGQSNFQHGELNTIELHNVVANENGQVSSVLLSDTSQPVEDEETLFEPTSFMELVGNVPVSVTKNDKRSKTFECPVETCDQIFDKECKLRVHMFSHNGASRPFKCTFKDCDWAFTTPYRLRRHEETHKGSKEFTCDFEGCDRKFTTIYNLKTHLKRHKWPNSLTCPAKDCQLSFANRRKLELHLRIHKDVEAPYKCNMCGKQYYSANCIASHYRTHQYNEDDFKCPFPGCGKVYDKICRLKQHVRHHTGDRPYVCPAEGCKWSFMSASKLTRHMRKHTGERRFTCTEPGCGKSFMRPEHLKGHIVIHSGDKPFHCPHENCNARFTAKSSLYVHVKKHCPSILKVVYPCPIQSCIKKYNSKATLKQHLVKFHPDMMSDGKEVNISQKLELTMPVSLVSQNSDNSASFLELEESVTDDPSSELKLIQATNTPVSVNGCANVSHTSVSSSKNVPKQTKGRSQNRNKVAVKMSENKPSTTEVRRIENKSKNIKLFQKYKNGCARTDIYCTYLDESKDTAPSPSYVYLNQNSNDSHDIKNYLSNSHLSTEVRSPDVMLASSIIFHDQTSEQFMKSSFLPDDCSSHSLYHEDSLLISSSAFEAELIPVSLLSDSVESDESVLIDTSSVIFSEQSTVDTFIEPISLHGLD